MSDEYNEMPAPWFGFGDRATNGEASDAYYKGLADLSPEARLCAAILADCADTLTWNPDSGETRKKRMAIRDARNWLDGKPTARPSVTFELCCALLHLDQDYIRRKMLARDVKIKEYKKQAPRWRRQPKREGAINVNS